MLFKSRDRQIEALERKIDAEEELRRNLRVGQIGDSTL